MKFRAWIPAAALLLLTAVTAGGWLWTREPLPAAPVQEGAASAKRGLRRAAPVRERLVDQTPLLTARSLLPLATTPEERQLARQAERLANHEVDLAFADALRRAASAVAAQTPELKELSALKAKAQAVIEADRGLLERLQKQLATAREAGRGPLEAQLEIVKAQMELDQDELEAASEELARAGGDPQARIRRLKEAHESADRESAQAMSAVPPASLFHPASLVARISEWSAQRAKLGLLDRARQEALAKTQALSKRRATLEARAKQEKDDLEAAKQRASELVQSAPGRPEVKVTVAELRQYGDAPRRLSDMGRRIEDQQELALVYGSWLELVDGQRNAALHRLLGVLGLVLAGFLAGQAIDRAFHHASAGERKGSGTLRTVAKLSVEVLCLLAILFACFGLPAQTTTILGLAGAGLTVALKDFIVAFFGWFILMGRNGIRVGDWVEIRGVGGEVVEIGLLRTVVLETGNWSDSGHPTGRRVAFVNNFAIEGHFFNFSTAGRWMWDELRVAIQAGQDPYPIIDGVQKLVERQTEANAHLAEQEWHLATARYRVQTFSTAPGVNVVSTPTGVEIRARYITRASERHATRLRLNQAVVELLHGPRGEAGYTGGKAGDR